MQIRTLLPVLPTLALAASSFGQTVFPEVEPNGMKSEATLASCMVAADQLTGMTTGTATTMGLATLATADTFRVKTCTLPLGVYRHTLTLTTSAGTAPTATIRGLNQTGGIPGTTDSLVLTSSAGLVAWYGFGKQEELYYRVTGAAATTGTYTATLATTQIVPTNVAGTFNPGTVTISSVGQGHTTDTDTWLYDSNLNAIPCAGDDDEYLGTTLQSRIIANLTAGTYYLAISTYNLAPSQPSCVGVDDFLTGIIMDFPDVVADSSTTINSNLTFSVTDGTTTTVQPATKTAIFGVEWFRIQVGNSNPATPFCFGDGSGTACPCGNSGAAGNGCASSVNAAGAHLAASGNASISADTLVITGTGMPNSSALYFQGTTQIAAGLGGVFGDGLRCAGGSVIRLGTKTNVAGTSSYPSGSPSISVKGANTAGAVRDYQVWYRNAAVFCTSSTFNLSNGIEVTWAP